MIPFAFYLLSLPVCMSAKVNLLLQATSQLHLRCVDLTAHRDHRWPGGRRLQMNLCAAACFDTGAACHVENTLGLLHFLFR